MPILPCVDHLGNKFKSVAEMLRYYNLSRGTYYSRLETGKGLKYALTGEDDEWIYDHEGNRFSSTVEMCNHWGIGMSTYSGRIRDGWNIKDALTTPANFTYRCQDHVGNVFKSKKFMCEHWGISIATFDKRIESGWNLEKALTTPVRTPKQCKDHEGNVFKNKSEMCNHWGIDMKTYTYRRKLGWSVEESLTKEVCDRLYLRELGCVDHLGNHYDSVKEMCDTYGISVSVYRQRVKAGMALEDIFKEVRIKWVDAVDHLGNKFKDTQDMCKHWNVSVVAFLGRLSNGWSLEAALTAPVKRCSRTYEVKDHEGRVHQSKSMMASYWGISYVALRGRLQRGWSLEKALTTPEQSKAPRSRLVEDHLGNKFKSKAEMCRYWHVNVESFNYRINKGFTLEESLTTPVKSLRVLKKD